MTQPLYRIVVDGGGTKTDAVLLDAANGHAQAAIAHGEPSAIIRTPPLDEAAQAVWKILSGLFDRLFQDSGADAQHVDRICLGLTGLGIGASKQKDALRHILERQGLARKTLLLSDAEMQFHGNFPGGPGILVIAGTGSIVLGRKAGDAPRALERAGGWGPQIGDPGSGYRIGLEMLRHVTNCLDREPGDPGAFAGEIMTCCGTRNAPEFRQWLFDHERNHGKVAALCEEALTWVDHPNAELARAARDLLDREIGQLARQVETLANRLRQTAPTIATAGGCFQGRQYSDRFRCRVEKTIADCRVISAKSPLDAGKAAVSRDSLWMDGTDEQLG